MGLLCRVQQVTPGLLCGCPAGCSLDLPWWEKLVGATFKQGRLQLKQLTGGKMDDITVIVALAEQVGVTGACMSDIIPQVLLLAGWMPLCTQALLA